jgi:endonuclease/exonuclease/phosphatase family metal-dependent hydrolase
MRSKHLPLALAAALAATLAACGDDDEDNTVPYVDDGKLTVMTRNLFLGAELGPILTATTPQEFVAATTAAWATVQANDFPARAERLADEIAAAQPDLVGLQEVSLWRTQSPGDAAVGGTTPATTVAIDYLAILLDRLAARGFRYVAVQVVELADIEVPILVPPPVNSNDVRLTDRDVILVREGVPVANPRGDSFAAAALGQVSVGGQALGVERGWSAVDATIGGKTVAFYNTHLEAFDLPVPGGGGLARPAQAAELVGILAAEAGPVVLVGDLNATPGVDAHLAITDAGFADAWTTLDPAADGFTCCFAEDLGDATATLTTRIDDVLLRPGTGTLTPEAATIVGEEVADRTASGLWPSDHAGLVVTIQP